MSARSTYCPTCLQSVVPEAGACPRCGLCLAGFALTVPAGLTVEPVQRTEVARPLAEGSVAEAMAIDESAYCAVRSMSSIHFIGLRDISVSMRFGGKAREANQALWEFLQSLADESNRDGFFVSLIDFHDRAELVIPRMRAAEALREFTPIKTSGHGTNYAAGLRLARTEAERPHDAFEACPVVVVLGDGGHNGPDDPRVEARRLHSLVDVVVAVAFGTDADEDLLRNHIASEPRLFWRIQESGAELRRFFNDLGKTLSYSLQNGVSVESSLSALR